MAIAGVFCCEYVRLGFASPVAFKECIDVLRLKSTVMAVANPVAPEQPAIAPLSDCIGMHMDKLSYLRDS